MRPLVLLLTCLFSLPLFAQFEDSETRIYNQFIVMLKPGYSIAQLTEKHNELKTLKCVSANMNIWLLERNTTQQAEQWLQVLSKEQSIKLAQFNHHVKKRALIPNDTYFGDQWGMWNTGQQSGVVGADIQAPDAWEINHENVTVNGDTIVIAIVDGNFDLGHEDINYWVNNSEVPANGIDDDGDGYIDDVNGWNVGDTSGNINSTGFDAYHSTHCAGIAAAIGDNGKGVAGVCWGAKIMGVNYNSTLESDVVAAYSYVRDMRYLYNTTFGSKGAFVVSTNSSFGVDKEHPADYPIWCAMYDSMGAVGILSAAATANGNWNIDTQGDIPTECPSKWLVAVTNTTRNDARNQGAAYGKVGVDLGAPGTGIYSTVPTPTLYQNMTGTSMSTPHVAGAIAAMYAAACPRLIDAYLEQPDSISLLIKDYLLKSAEWNSALNNITSSNGRLNLYRAFMYLKRYNCDSCNFNITIDKIPVSCKGASNGAMAVRTDVGSAVEYSILWSNTVTTPECLSMAPGFYSVSVTDSTGCRRTWTEELHDPDTLIIGNVVTQPALNGNQGSITISASGGTDSLWYSIDGTTWQLSNTFSVAANGTFTVYVKNQSGCIVQKSVLVSGVNEVNENTFSFSVYPNPAKDVLNVTLEISKASTLTIAVVNLVGQAVNEVQQNVNGGISTVSVNTATLAQGIYLLQINNGSEKIVKRFAVEH
ncbi:MAG: S8/S53 family peptidase [Chitinophagales bacterium]